MKLQFFFSDYAFADIKEEEVNEKEHKNGDNGNQLSEKENSSDKLSKESEVKKKDKGK